MYKYIDLFHTMYIIEVLLSKLVCNVYSYVIGDHKTYRQFYSYCGAEINSTILPKIFMCMRCCVVLSKEVSSVCF